MYLNRADQIAEEIQEQIFAGSFKDGERLDEIRLAEQFGVSRTPLREALKKVALLGIVEKIPKEIQAAGTCTYIILTASLCL